MAQPRVSSLRRIQPALARLKKRLLFKSRYCLGRYAGIPILAHWSILAMLPLFYLLSDRPGEGRSLWYALLAGASFAMLMCLHEIGHAFVARKRGIFVSGIFIYPFHGRCLHEMPEYELDDVLIAWGGVAAQAIVLLAALALGPALDYAPYEVRSQLSPLFAVFISMNIATILLNLLPIAPLDGHLAWRIIPLLLARMRRREWRLRMPKKKPGYRWSSRTSWQGTRSRKSWIGNNVGTVPDHLPCFAFRSGAPIALAIFDPLLLPRLLATRRGP